MRPIGRIALEEVLKIIIAKLQLLVSFYKIHNVYELVITAIVALS